ncbi:ATP-dependent Clp protease proteolytic subunit, partial [bacterium]|nr:ATP-dependent Clp protease proteolytic subunit [bacterium]
MGGVQGQASDIKIKAEQILKIKDRLNQILVKHTGKDLKNVEKDTDRDYYMTADEALKYGLIDKVIK